MSSVVRTQTRVKAQGTAKVRVSMWDLVRAEVTRSRRTFTWGVIGATLIFTVHTIILANASISSGVVTELQWNGNALAWMHMYAGGFAVPLGLLTGAMAQWREQRWRQGGTAWRAVAPRRVAAARLVVLSLSALACQVALVAPHRRQRLGSLGPVPAVRHLHVDRRHRGLRLGHGSLPRVASCFRRGRPCPRLRLVCGGRGPG